MEWGIDISEKLKVPIYVESTLNGFPLYEKAGFQKVDGILCKREVTHLDSDVEAPLMARMPASAGGMSLQEWADSGKKQ